MLKGYPARYSLLLVVGLISVPIMLSAFFISERLSMPMLGEVAAAVTLGVVLSVARSRLSFVYEHRRHRFSSAQFFMITLDRRRLQTQETGGAAHHRAPGAGLPGGHPRAWPRLELDRHHPGGQAGPAR